MKKTSLLFQLVILLVLSQSVLGSPYSMSLIESSPNLASKQMKQTSNDKIQKVSYQDAPILTSSSMTGSW